MHNRVKDYILDNEFRLTLFKDRVNIVNYSKLLQIDNKEMIISNSYSKIYIKGTNLVLNKLLDNEILISGLIFSIEVKYEQV